MRFSPSILAAIPLAILAAAPGAGKVPAGIPTPPPLAPGAIYGSSAEPLARGVFAISQGNEFHLQPRGNVGVIEQRDGFVLVDSGGSPEAADQVIGFIKARSSKAVKAIVITHWHGDHPLGLSRLLEQWPGARVISTRQTRDMLAGPKADAFMPGESEQSRKAYLAQIDEVIEFLGKTADRPDLGEADRAGFARARLENIQFRREMERVRRVVPTEMFEERLDLPDSRNPVQVLFLGRANTSGDAVVWLPKQKIVFTGDIVVAPIPFGFNSHPREWIEVLGKIKAMNFATLVPGHGSPQRDNAYIDRLAAMLTSVRSQVAPLAGETDDPVKLADKVNLDAARDAFAGADPWLRRWFRNYWKYPIVSSALREARGEEIVQGAE